MLKNMILLTATCLGLFLSVQQTCFAQEQMKAAVIAGEWKSLAENTQEDAIGHFTKAVANGVIGNYKLMSDEFDKSKSDKSAINTFCDELLNHNPKNGYVTFLDGVRLYDLGETVKGISSYKKSIDLDPKFAAPYVQIGLHYGQKEKDNSQEILWLNKAIAADQTYYPAYYALGAAYNEMGKQSLAIEQFKKTLELLEAAKISKGQPFGDASYNLGWMFLNQSPPDNDKGIDLMEKAIAADPNRLEAYTELGIAYKRKGQFSKSVQTYKNGISKGADSAKIYFNLGVSEYRNGNTQGAKTAFQKAISLDPGGQIGNLAKQWLGQVQ